MADANSGTPERVAYRLFEHIQSVEGKSFFKEEENAADREWILSTYAECRDAVRGGESAISVSGEKIPERGPSKISRVTKKGANKVSLAKETGANRVSLAMETGANRVS